MHNRTGHQKRRSFSIRNLVSALLMVFALGLLFYPIVANYFVGQQNTVTVQKYQKATGKLNKVDVNQLNANAQIYNQYLFAMSQHEPWKQEIPDYKTQLMTDNSGMIGYLTIPQIKLQNVPIYSGDSEETLLAGIGHIPQTSLPIGGKNTHSVLSAHSGRVNNALFTDLEDLKLGDVFYIHVLDKDLKYQIDDRKIIEPNDVSSLNIVPGKDLVTLVTCWPTGINNKRLLVTGHRIPYNVAVPQEKIQRNQYGYNFWVMFGSALLVLLAILLGWLSHLKRRRHTIRVDRAQYTAIKNGSQKMLIASKKIVDANSRFKEHKTYREGDLVLLKAWELLPDTEDSSYYRLENSVWVNEIKSNKAEKQKAKLLWLTEAAALNALLDEFDQLDLSEKFAGKKTVTPGYSLAEAEVLIQVRLGLDRLPEDCILLGIKLS